MALDVSSPLAERIAGPGPEPEVLRSIGASLAWLRQEGLMLETDVEIDPDLELTGVQKHLDGTIPILFHSVKGHPGAEVVTNLFANIEILDRMFGWQTPQQRTVKLAHALTHPIPGPACQGKEAFSLSTGALKVAHNIVKVRLRLVNGHQDAGIPCIAEMAHHFQRLVIEGNGLAGGESLCRLFRCLEEIL